MRFSRWFVAHLLAASLALAFMGCSRSNTESRQEEATAEPPEATGLPPEPGRTTGPGRTFARLEDILVKGDRPEAQRKPAKGEPKQAGTGHRAGPSRGHKGDSDGLFTNLTALRIEIEIPRAGLNVLRRSGWGNGQDRPVAKATVKEGGVVYTNVAIHLKGAAGSHRSIDDKPALTLNFDKFVPEQSFHGLHKLSLNNSVQDPSYLCEKLAREMFLAAGVPAPRAGHALVTLNGRDLGLYVLLEGANKQFLKRYFEDPTGNLYDGGFCQEVNTGLAVNSGDHPNDSSGLKNLLNVLKERSPSLERLNTVLDVDRFLSMMAIEIMLCHWDGYVLNRNNWRIFHDLQAKRMVFIPHGLDQLFGTGRHFDPASPILPGVAGAVAQAVLSTKEGQRRYRERVGQLYTNVFNVDALSSRVDEIVTGLTPGLSEDYPQVANSLARHAAVLKRRIVQRGEGLRDQLGVAVAPLDFGPDHTIHLTKWRQVVGKAGAPSLSQLVDTSGKTNLSINAGSSGTSSSSWRARVVLEPGNYRFEGRLRMKDVVIDEGDTRGGAGLRISQAMPRKLTGTAGWSDFRFPFSVEGEASDVELICELRAAKGEVWFDLGSLKVLQLP